MIIPVKPFYMIRHGQTEANAAQTMSGQVDTKLTEEGIAQARAIAGITHYLDPRPEIIVHSFLKRTRDTAMYLNENLALEMIEHSDWAEQHFGDWQGKTYTDARELIHAGETPPNGESREVFNARIRKAAAYTLENYNHPLVVSHGGVFRALAANYGLHVAGVKNCVLYAFEPKEQSNEGFPWHVYEYDVISGERSQAPAFR